MRVTRTIYFVTHTTFEKYRFVFFLTLLYTEYNKLIEILWIKNKRPLKCVINIHPIVHKRD
jgi:hypothetical protein